MAIDHMYVINTSTLMVHVIAAAIIIILCVIHVTIILIVNHNAECGMASWSSIMRGDCVTVHQ